MVAERKRLHSNRARISVVGGGKMGEAILGGWIASHDGVASAWDASCITVVDPGEERRRYLEDAYGVACIDDVAKLQDADLVLLSVKPQVMAGVLERVRKLSFASDALFVSIAAGLSTGKLEDMLPEGVHVVRVMPNTPLLVGKGASTLCGGSRATQDEVDLAFDLFSCIGEAFVVPEEQIDATCAIHGAGPAYVAALIEALAKAGAEAGLDRDLAERLGTQTAYGTACLMLERGQNAEKTRVDVCSPGGATLAALGAMEAAGFSESIMRGVEAAIRRSKELGA